MNIRTIFGITCFLVFAIFVYLDFENHSLEWKVYTREFRQLEIERANTKAERDTIKKEPVEIQQILIRELGITDRCISCHHGVDNPTYGGAKQPFSYHPNHEDHPFDKFGCTVCHHGQGRALTKEAAHGHEENWNKPLLKNKFIEASCGWCHIIESLNKTESLKLGRDIFDNKGCRGCHKINGIGGNIAPDLSKMNSKRHLSPEWLIDHFKDPSKITPGSPMPQYKLSDNELTALTIYTISLVKKPLTEYFLSKKIIPDPESGLRLIKEKKCFSCHGLNKMISSKSTDTLKRYLLNPKEIVPNSKKPILNLRKDEVDAIAGFLINVNSKEFLKFPIDEQTNDPVARGKKVFKKYGCAGCHGEKGRGGIRNYNAKTAEKVPALKFVREGYKKSQLREKIIKGMSKIQKKDPGKPAPPLYMPAWGDKISEQELNDLVEFLFSLLPKSEELDW